MKAGRKTFFRDRSDSGAGEMFEQVIHNLDGRRWVIRTARAERRALPFGGGSVCRGGSVGEGADGGGGVREDVFAVILREIQLGQELRAENGGKFVLRIQHALED